MLAELRARSTNIRELGGDHRLEAFIIRLAQFEGRDEDMEGLASMAVNKPPRDWVDPDVDRAAVELAELAQRFHSRRSVRPRQGPPRQEARHGRGCRHGRSTDTSPRRVRDH